MTLAEIAGYRIPQAGGLTLSGFWLAASATEAGRDRQKKEAILTGLLLAPAVIGLFVLNLPRSR